MTKTKNNNLIPENLSLSSFQNAQKFMNRFI